MFAEELMALEQRRCTLNWVCAFCGARQVWEGGIPNEQEMRQSREQVARATANHLHCSGCDRYISRGAVIWEWDYE